MSIIASLYDRIIHLVSVPKCVNCGEPLDFPSRALCPDCFSKYQNTKDRSCHKCARQLYMCDCSNNFLASHGVKRLMKVFRYRASEENLAANSLIYSLKQDNRKDVVRLLANEIAKSISLNVKNPKSCIFTNVPRRNKAITKYGIDHAALLAKALAKLFGAEYSSLLKSCAKRPQKEMHGSDRIKNAEVSPRRKVSLRGRRIILVDDIVTTGASMAISAMTLRSMGAKEIIGAAVAIAYKND